MTMAAGMSTEYGTTLSTDWRRSTGPNLVVDRPPGVSPGSAGAVAINKALTANITINATFTKDDASPLAFKACNKATPH
jgi:hypothetical protein